MAQCSPSTSVVRVLRICIISLQALVLFLMLPTARELIRRPLWSRRAIPCMGRHPLAESSGNGAVFAISADGTGFTNLHVFTAILLSYPPPGNIDGAQPWGGLILSGNTLYGTTFGGGSWSNGTVFRLNTDGAGFTNLHSFTAGS